MVEIYGRCLQLKTQWMVLRQSPKRRGFSGVIGNMYLYHSWLYIYIYIAVAFSEKSIVMSHFISQKITNLITDC